MKPREHRVTFGLLVTFVLHCVHEKSRTNSPFSDKHHGPGNEVRRAGGVLCRVLG